jgi:microcystin-dependent protein
MFSDTYIGVIGVFAGNFAPQNWMFCNGQLVSISQYTALYSLIGTTYGGDGEVSFALPDFRSRVAVGAGQGPGLSNYTIGEMDGVESVALTLAQMPAHTHEFVSLNNSVQATSNPGTLNTPSGNIPAATGSINTYNTAGTGAMAATVNNTHTPLTGVGNSWNNLSPVLAMNYVIAVEGIFPSRN